MTNLADATRELANKECKPCKGDVPPLRGKELQDLHGQLNSGWKVLGQRQLEKEYKFKDYDESTAFCNAVADIAKEQNHHPDILLTYNTVKVTIWTHKINGLTESDFVFAAKCEQAFG
jgi:4a-hydroxytetrahydrobiopterin dehydratase